MKVLWFSNTPAGGEKILNLDNTRGGWLVSLEKVLKEKVNLSVAFNYVKYAERFENEGVKYYPISKRNWKYHMLKNKFFGEFTDTEDLQVYLDIINTVKPDIIHIHGTENPFGCIIGQVEVPVVQSIQGNYTVSNYKYFSGIERKYATMRGISLRKPYTWVFNRSRNHRYKTSSVPKTAREKRNLRNCRNIIGRTDWDRRITRILAPESTYFHNDEMLREPFYYHKWQDPGNKKLIIHTTTGESIFKGFETICMSLNELNKIGIDVEWRVAGFSSGSLVDRMVKKKIGNSYPKKGLVLMGNLKQEILIRSMLEADIYVLPSHIENSPNSLCEAMIMGMPCITTLAGGSSTILRDKEEGIVIQSGDPWVMSGAILELHSDRELAISYGEKARKKALARHDRDKIVTDLMTIYKTILNQ